MSHVRQIETTDPSALESFLSGVGPGEAFEALTRLLPDAAVFVVDGERKVLHWSDGADEKTRIERALEATGGRVSQAAAALGMSRPTFWRKRKNHGLA